MKVSEHAVDKFMLRSGRKKKAGIEAKLLDMLAMAEKVVLKPGYRATQILKYKFKECLYFRYSDWILVVDEESQVVVTCYRSGELRWTTEAK